MAVTIYYDGDCPLCANYVGFLRLKQAFGAPHLVDLRDDAAARDALQSAGYDLDKGMVAEVDGLRYFGADAVNVLAMMSGPVGFVNRIAGAIFSSPLVAKAAYPFLRAGRDLALTALGRDRIAGSDAAVDAKFTLFALTFGTFSVFHFAIYVGEYLRFPPSLDMVAVLVAGLAVMTRPGSRGLFLLLVATSLVSAWIQAPAPSNHTMLRNVTLLGFVIVYVIHLLRGSSWNRMFLDFSAVGGVGLLVMYFFGIFHKINTGFLDLERSCAVSLWKLMPPPMSFFQFEWMYYVAIYSTFVVEGAMMAGLLWRPTRHIAIVMGILFHMLLALSSFAMYLPFSMLAVSLHILFLSPQAAQNVMNSPIMKAYLARLHDPVMQVAGVMLLLTITTVAVFRHYTLATMLGSVFVLPLCAAILLYGRAERKKDPARSPARFGYATACLVGGAFFLACLSPYLGLKNTQSMNMFANLRTEGGVSNHLVMRHVPPLFSFLNNVALITEAHGAPFLEKLVDRQIGVVEYDLLRQIRDNPQAVVSYTINGVPFVAQTAATLAARIDATLFSDAVNKFLHFGLVPIDMRPVCR